MLSSFFHLGSFTYTSLADFIFLWGVSLTHPVLAFFFSPPPPPPSLSGELFFHIRCWLYFSVGSFSYTSYAGFIFSVGSFSNTSHAIFFSLFFIWGVSLTHPLLASFLSREFLLHLPCWLYCLSGEFPLNIPYLLYFFCGEFLLHVPCWLLYLIWGVSLTHPMLVSFLSGEFLLYIPCCLDFYGRSLSYTCWL